MITYQECVRWSQSGQHPIIADGDRKETIREDNRVVIGRYNEPAPFILDVQRRFRGEGKL